MACLQFRYDGYKRPHRKREMCFFPQRFPYQNQCCRVPKDYSKLVKQTEISPDEIAENSSPMTGEKPIVANESVLPIKDSSPIASDQTIKEDSQEKSEQKKLDFAQISEILISKLSTTETNLSEIRNMVETGKPFLDDFIYKIESFMQIIEIIKANERRRFSKPQTQVASVKTTKDSYDEFLELLQGPVFQNVLRQFLISIMVRNDDVTKFNQPT